MEKFKEKLGWIIALLVFFIPLLLIRKLNGNTNFMALSVIWIIFGLMAGVTMISQYSFEHMHSNLNRRRKQPTYQKVIMEVLRFAGLFAAYVFVIAFILNKCNFSFIDSIEKIILSDFKQLSKAFMLEPVARRVLIPVLFLPIIGEFILISIPSNLIKNDKLLIWVISIMTSLAVCCNLPHPVLYFALVFPLAFYMGYRFIKSERNIFIPILFNIIVDCSAAAALIE